MTAAWLPLAADIDLGDLAYVVLFVVVGIIELVRRVLQGKRAPRPERSPPRPAPTESGGEPWEDRAEEAEEEAPRRRPAPRPPAAHGPPLGGAPGGESHVTARGVRRTPLAPATVSGGPAAVAGPALLRGAPASPRDRVRQAFLWREVLGPPAALREGRATIRRRR